MKPPETIRLTPGKRVLFLTKDPELIRRQLRGELDLRMEDLPVDDLLDDINTDAMTPAWVCFSHRPEDIARDAYAGLIVDGKRLFERDALINGNFEVIVSGYRKGVGSSRETAVQAEKWSGIRIAVAASFAPIHARNNISQGVLMGDHEHAPAAAGGRGDPARRVLRGVGPDHPARHPPRRPVPVLEGARRRRGGAAAPGHRPAADDHGREDPRPASPRDERGPRYVKPGDAVVVARRRRLHPRVHHRPGPLLPGAGVRGGLPGQEPGQVRRLRGPPDLRRRGAQDARLRATRSRPCAQLQREFQRHTGVRDFSAKDGISPGICHEVAREHIIDPGDFIQATDSHTCMGGVNNALDLGRRRDRVRRPGPPGLHAGRGAGVDPLRADRQARAGGHRQGPDALHPPRTTPGRSSPSTG